MKTCVLAFAVAETDGRVVPAEIEHRQERVVGVVGSHRGPPSELIEVEGGEGARSKTEVRAEKGEGVPSDDCERLDQRVLGRWVQTAAFFCAHARIDFVTDSECLRGVLPMVPWSRAAPRLCSQTYVRSWY